ncbi:MAG: PAS domain S-box protein [Acidiferrobacterales bacterium]
MLPDPDPEHPDLQQERAFRAQFADSALPMLVYEFDTLQFLDANPAAVRHYGYTREEFLGMRATDLHLPEERLAPTPEPISENQPLEPCIGECRHRRKGGSVISVLVTRHPLVISGRRVGLAVIQDVTKHDSAPKSLTREHKFRNKVLEHVTNAIFALDLDGCFTMVNRAATEISGYPAHALIGRSGAALFAPEKLPEMTEQFQRIVVNGESVLRYEVEFLRPDGARRIVSLSGAPLYQKGRITGVAGLAEDVTEHRRLAQQLRRLDRVREAMSRCTQALVRATDDVALLREVCHVIVEVGDYRLAWVNFADDGTARTPHLAACAGCEEICPEGFQPDMAETGHDRRPASLAIRTARPALAQNILLDPAFSDLRAHAGLCGYAAWAALPLVEAGRAFGAISICAAEPDAFATQELSLLVQLADDLAYGLGALRMHSVRNRVERALQDSDERFRATFEQAAVGMVLTDPQERYLRVNQAFCDMLGYTREELLGKANKDVTCPDDVANDLAERTQQLENGAQTYTLEKRFIRKDGKIVWANLSGSLVRDRQGNDAYYIGVVEDISDRKRAQEALECRTIELTERVKELRCLYAVARIVEDEGDGATSKVPDEVYQSVVDALPPAFQYPEAAVARLVLAARVYLTHGYVESPWSLSVSVRLNGQDIGMLEVCYQQPAPGN